MTVSVYLDGSNVSLGKSPRAFLACLESFVSGICRAGASGVDALRAVGPCLCTHMACIM